MTMGNNAVYDILMNERYQGVISSIQGFTDIVDGGFTTVITFLAFFIISVALLRNVLAGTYCAFPKFWDAVAEAHGEYETKKFSEMISGLKNSYKEASMSSVKKFILGVVPNVKKLTDFDDDTLNPKDYFVRAIPQMIGVVIIGVFIYNGYYRDVTAMVTNVGSYAIKEFVLSVDPISAFEDMMNTAGRPVFATDNSLTDIGKNKNKMAGDIYYNVINRYKDIKGADIKATIAAGIDNAVNKIVESDATLEAWLSDNAQYAVNIRVETVKDFNASTYTDTNSDDYKQWSFKLGMGPEAISTGTAIINFDTTDAAKTEGWCLRVSIAASRNVNDSKVSTSIGNVWLVMGVAASDPKLTYDAGESVDGSSGGSNTALRWVKTETATDRKITISNGGTGEPDGPVEGKYRVFSTPLKMNIKDSNGKTVKITIVGVKYVKGSGAPTICTDDAYKPNNSGYTLTITGNKLVATVNEVN